MKEFIITFFSLIIFASLISVIADEKQLSGYYSFAAVIVAICFFITKIPSFVNEISIISDEEPEIVEDNYWDSVTSIVKINIENDIKELTGAKEVTVTVDTNDTFAVLGLSVKGVKNITHAYELIHEKYGLEREVVDFD